MCLPCDRAELLPNGWDLRMELRMDSAVEMLALAVGGGAPVEAEAATGFALSGGPAWGKAEAGGGTAPMDGAAAADFNGLVTVVRCGFGSPSCTMRTSPLLRPSVASVASSPADVSSGRGGWPVRISCRSGAIVVAANKDARSSRREAVGAS